MTSVIRDYIELCKPRVVMLMILTSMVGMCLASNHAIPLISFTMGNLGIALMASAAAALNHLADQHLDRLMGRTKHRPLVQGRISQKNCLIFAIVLGVVGLFILLFFINVLTAVLTFFSLIGYAVCYTLYLKHATPQNIVIGGIAGAIPPLLGWTAVSGQVSAEALLLVLIIYVWTPPHFWALAIFRYDDYAEANIPMLPNTHSISYTKLNIVLYTILLSCVSCMPYIIGMCGLIYISVVSIVNLQFLFYVIRLYRRNERKDAIQTFRFSIYYLGILFLSLLIDHYYLLS